MARGWRPAFLAASGAWLAVVALCGPVRAHTVLVDSSVGLDAAILRQNVEAHLALRFSGGVEPRDSRVELVPDHGAPRRLPVMFGPGPGDVAVTVPALTAGRYVLRYRVVAADGHVTEGTTALRVAAPE